MSDAVTPFCRGDPRYRVGLLRWVDPKQERTAEQDLGTQARELDRRPIPRMDGFR